MDKGGGKTLIHQKWIICRFLLLLNPSLNVMCRRRKKSQLNSLYAQSVAIITWHKYTLFFFQPLMTTAIHKSLDNKQSCYYIWTSSFEHKVEVATWHISIMICCLTTHFISVVQDWQGAAVFVSPLCLPVLGRSQRMTPGALRHLAMKCCTSLWGLARYSVHFTATALTKLLHHFLYMLDPHPSAQNDSNEPSFPMVKIVSSCFQFFFT